MVNIDPLKLLHYIGYYGPDILFFVTFTLLFSDKMMIAVYIAGFFINLWLNEGLKSIFVEQRPSQRCHSFNYDFTEKYTNVKELGAHEYGMPSGHAQAIFYSVAFIHFVLKNTNITLGYLLIALNTMYQRVLYKNHSIAQVFAGAAFGWLFGYFIYAIYYQPQWLTRLLPK